MRKLTVKRKKIAQIVEQKLIENSPKQKQDKKIDKKCDFVVFNMFSKGEKAYDLE